MNGERDRDEVMDRRLDWALGENGGSAVPPDVASRVVARFRAGEVVEIGEAVPLRSRRWLAAAVMLLGLGVVVAVAMSRRAGPSSFATTGPQGGPAPTFVVVTNRAEIDALPADTKFVDGRCLSDSDVAALARLPLEGLKLSAWGRPEDASVPLLTEAVLPTLATMRNLRLLHLHGQDELTGKRLDALRDLPRLEELGLMSFDTDDAALAVIERMPSLRRLDLSGNQTFYGEAIKSMARCPGLRSLSLQNCGQLNAAMLAPLAGMRQLEELSLGAIGNTFRAGFYGHDAQKQRVANEEYQRLKQENGAGLTDAALADLGDKPMLRKLDLSRGMFSDDGLRALNKCGSLEELILTDSAQLTIAAMTHLPATVRRLDLSRNPWLNADAMAVMPRDLNELVAHDCVSVDDDALATLAKRCPHLQHIDLNGCMTVTETGIANLRTLKDLRPSKTMGMSKESALGVFLPVDVIGNEDARFVRLRNKASRVVKAVQGLRNCEWLETLDFDEAGAASWRNSFGLRPLPDLEASIDDDGLRDLATLTKLRYLGLASSTKILGPGIAALAALPVLETLDLRLLRIEDDALLALPKFPALRTVLFDEPLGLTGAGIATLTRCQSLRKLRLTNCVQLSGADLAQLGAMTSLEELDLSQLPAGGELKMAKDRTNAHWSAILDRAATTTFLNSGGGLDDTALAGLQKLVNVRSLGLAYGTYTRDGLTALLARLTKLQHLDLMGCTSITAIEVAKLSPSLRSLNIQPARRNVTRFK